MKGVSGGLGQNRRNRSTDIMTILAILLIGGAAVLVSTTANARVWRVEKDGSGDFLVIQSAVDAAASGDTIRVGRGRFDEKQLVSCPGWTEYVRILITKPDLTIIGSGTETIVGQETPYDPSQGFDIGIAASTYWTNHALRVRDIVFINMCYGVNSADITLDIAGCIFTGCRYAILTDGVRADVYTCRFEGAAPYGISIACFNQTGTIVRDCRFDAVEELPHRINVGFDWCNEIVVENCDFNGGDLGVGFGFPSSGIVRRCSFNGQFRYSMYVTDASTVVIEDCEILNSTMGIRVVNPEAVLTVQRCVIADVQDCSVLIEATSPQTVVTNCDLDKGARYAVRTRELFDTYPTYYIDFRNNYWGTDSPDSIRSWIYDQNDGLTTNYVIRYSPFRGESTPTETATWGAVKSLFR